MTETGMDEQQSSHLQAKAKVSGAKRSKKGGKGKAVDPSLLGTYD